ncbi:hypothetical protein RCL1_000842 [Eukaryota sp. TZLM3-RCL]
MASTEYYVLRRRFKEELLKSRYSLSDLPNAFQKCLHDTEEGKNFCLFLLNAQQPPSNDPVLSEHNTEPLTIVLHARQRWEFHVVSSLQDLVSEMQLSFISPPQHEVDLNRLRFIWEPSQLLDVVSSFSSPNHVSLQAPYTAPWGVIKLEIFTPNIQLLNSKILPNLSPKFFHFGLDDVSFVQNDCSIISKRIKFGSSVVKFSYPLLSRYFLQCGCHNGLRPDLWANILEIPYSKAINSKSNCAGKESSLKAIYESLLGNVDECRLIVDDLMTFDIRSCALNDSFFPFEDSLVNILHVFNRDSRVYRDCRLDGTAFLERPSLSTVAKSKIPYPPSGVLPFKGISLFAGALCYLSTDESLVYEFFRKLWTKYFSKLSNISSQNSSFLTLCRNFENLLVERDAELFYHFISIDIQPLKLCYNWIFYGFADFLSVDQWFILWDRIIGFDNLILIPLLAASIFVFKRNCLLHVKSEAEVVELISDGDQLLVVPLLQNFLYFS